MNTHPANAVFHAINEAIQPPEPSMEEILAELLVDLEDARARLFCAEMREDPYMRQREMNRWNDRITAISRQITIVEGAKL